MVRRTITMPREADLGLASVANRGGLTVSVLPNGSLFAIEHKTERSSILINQVLGQPIYGGIGRIYLRTGGERSFIAQLVGPEARVRFGHGERSLVWEGQTGGIRHRVVLELHEADPIWLWRIEIATDAGRATPCDVILVQDVGLGGRGFVMGSEAYVSQYIDHQIATHPGYGPVVMCRQAQSQGGGYPWLALGLLEGAAAYATDAIQVMGPAHREAGLLGLPFGTNLPTERMQHEVACPMLQSKVVTLIAGRAAAPHLFRNLLSRPPGRVLGCRPRIARVHPGHGAAAARAGHRPRRGRPQHPSGRSSPRCGELGRGGAGTAVPDPQPAGACRRRLSCPSSSPTGPITAMSSCATRSASSRAGIGAMLRSGGGMMLDDRTLCATHWMHGVFAAQLTIGNTSFHKLFSVSRDPYNSRGRAACGSSSTAAKAGASWRFPRPSTSGSATAAGSTASGGRTITVPAIADGRGAGHAVAPRGRWRRPAASSSSAISCSASASSKHAGRVAIDVERKRFTLQPDPDSLWGRTLSGRRLPSRHGHARRGRGDRRRRAPLSRTASRGAAPMSRCARGRRPASASPSSAR